MKVNVPPESHNFFKVHNGMRADELLKRICDKRGILTDFCSLAITGTSTPVDPNMRLWDLPPNSTFDLVFEVPLEEQVMLRKLKQGEESAVLELHEHAQRQVAQQNSSALYPQPALDLIDPAPPDDSFDVVDDLETAFELMLERGEEPTMQKALKILTDEKVAAEMEAKNPEEAALDQMVADWEEDTPSEEGGLRKSLDRHMQAVDIMNSLLAVDNIEDAINDWVSQDDSLQAFEDILKAESFRVRQKRTRGSKGFLSDTRYKFRDSI
ncbi:MAG TPA: hypothetical protein V6D20_17685 [Candidatus Obscuribacterales bacterium]